MKTVQLAVTNDIQTDQRVNKMARTLQAMGFRIRITGVWRGDSIPFSPAYAETKRFRMLFQKKFLFYAEYNLRLLFYLLFQRFDVLVSNDLDTLPACHLVAWLRRKPLVYDAHEYYTGTPEVSSRPGIYRFWKTLERMLVPRQKTMITVNKSLATLYRNEYGVNPWVVRNVPRYKEPRGRLPGDELSLPPHKDIVLLQGAGINVDRGSEELVRAMHPSYGLSNVLLLIIGSGDVLTALKEMVSGDSLQERVWFLDRMPPEELYEYTIHARIGVSLDKDTNLNYRYSLPNKLFDYMMAGVPQLVSNLPEVAGIVKTYETGMVALNHEPGHIAHCIGDMLSDMERWKLWHRNCLEAAKKLCWENEESTVRDIYRKFSENSQP